jgi:DeoR/GlpR family transcriptional regulator of sugar metabolism
MIPGWKDEIQRDYLEFLRGHGKVSPAELAAHLNISECCVVYWLTDLAREGKVRILAAELVEESALPGEPQTALTCQRKEYCPVPEEAEAELVGVS